MLHFSWDFLGIQWLMALLAVDVESFDLDFILNVIYIQLVCLW